MYMREVTDFLFDSLFHFFWVYMQKWELLSHVPTFIFNFEFAHPVSIVATPRYILQL